MPDFSLCRQHECPKRNDCARYLGVAGRYQSYIAPRWDENGCNLFWDTKWDVPFKLMKDRGKENVKKVTAPVHDKIKVYRDD